MTHELKGSAISPIWHGTLTKSLSLTHISSDSHKVPFSHAYIMGLTQSPFLSRIWHGTHTKSLSLTHMAWDSHKVPFSHAYIIWLTQSPFLSRIYHGTHTKSLSITHVSWYCILLLFVGCSCYKRDPVISTNSVSNRTS